MANKEAKAFNGERGEEGNRGKEEGENWDREILRQGGKDREREVRKEAGEAPRISPGG